MAVDRGLPRLIVLNVEEGPRSPPLSFGYAEYIKQSTNSIKDRGMSIEAQPEDPQALKDAIGNVRSDQGGSRLRKSWVLVKHVNNDPATLTVVGEDCSDEASFDDFVAKLEDDQVMYGLLRLATNVDMSANVKFVYVHWIGENVAFAKRGRFGVVHGSVEAYFNPYHVLLETGIRDELSLDEITKRVMDSAMTSSRVLDVDPTAGRQERGFTQHSTRKAQNSAGVGVGGGIIPPRSVAPGGASLEVSPEVQAAILDVRNDDSATTWVVAAFEEGDLRKPLVVAATGESGGIDEIKEHLADDQVSFVLYRTKDTVDNIACVKFVHFCYVGDQVKPMVKAKLSTITNAANASFSPYHVYLFIDEKHELSEDIVNDKVQASAGTKSWVTNNSA